MIASTEALASIPDELSATEAAPLMCVGITTYNALRNSGARVGDVVAILGICGLGHLGIQFAAKMGFKTIALARGKERIRRSLYGSSGQDNILIANRRILSKSLSSLEVPRSFLERSQVERQ
jgi:D-arabinose 1-dehydrogenase-like Zn-dependent alcohol dehydrogenase